MDDLEPAAPTAADQPPVARRVPLHRAITRFITDPGSARNAIYLIVAADLVVVLIGGTIIWLLDRAEFEHLTEAFWYILQTVTTVGYGDVTPIDPLGRLIGGIIMLLGIASLSILTASITSSFIESRQARRRIQEEAQDDARWTGIQTQLSEVIERLDRLEGLAGGDRNVGDA